MYVHLGISRAKLLLQILPHLGVVVGLGLAFWRVVIRSAGPGLPAGYRKALRMLARRGYVRGPQTTARDFANDVRRTLPGTGARAFCALTEGYLAARFGGRALDDASDCLQTLRESLREPAVSANSAE